MANQRLTDALATIRRSAVGIGGSTGFVSPGSDEAKALDAFLTVMEITAENIQAITEMASEEPPVEPPAPGRHAGR